MILNPLLLCLGLSGPASAASALFLGNSYTHVNELDQLVLALLQEGQPSWADGTATRLTDGGLTFADHVERIGTAGTAWSEALGEGGPSFDWVILQEQSQIPGFPSSNAEYVASLEAAVALDEIAEAHGAATVFFLTWGREHGDDTNPDIYPDFPTMEARLEAGYAAYRDAASTSERPTWIAPVGPAFAWVYEDAILSGDDPTGADSRFGQLFSEDGSHPSPLGSYLAACVFYATLTGDSPEGLSPSAALSAEDAGWAQLIAATVVFDEDLGYTYPWTGAGSVDTGSVDTGSVDKGSVDTGTPDTGTPDTGAPSDPEKSSSGGCFGRASALMLLAGLGRRRR